MPGSRASRDAVRAGSRIAAARRSAATRLSPAAQTTRPRRAACWGREIATDEGFGGDYFCLGSDEVLEQAEAGIAGEGGADEAWLTARTDQCGDQPTLGEPEATGRHDSRRGRFSALEPGGCLKFSDSFCRQESASMSMMWQCWTNRSTRAATQAAPGKMVPIA